MLTNRIIACLDVMDGRVVKGTGFVDLRDAGDPVVLAEQYEAQGADEIVYLDISATDERRGTLLDLVRRTSERLFIPLTVGGGMRRVEDIANALRAGADKTAINSAAIRRPELLTEAARRFGSQCVVLSVDARRASSREYHAPCMCQSSHRAARDPPATWPLLLFAAVPTRRCSPAYCTMALLTSEA